MYVCSGYLISFKNFHELYESNNPPKCSAKDMAEFEEDDKDDDAVFSIGTATHVHPSSSEQMVLSSIQHMLMYTVHSVGVCRGNLN